MSKWGIEQKQYDTKKDAVWQDAKEIGTMETLMTYCNWKLRFSAFYSINFDTSPFFEGNFFKDNKKRTSVAPDGHLEAENVTP